MATRRLQPRKKSFHALPSHERIFTTRHEVFAGRPAALHQNVTASRERASRAVCARLRTRRRPAQLLLRPQPCHPYSYSATDVASHSHESSAASSCFACRVVLLSVAVKASTANADLARRTGLASLPRWAVRTGIGRQASSIHAILVVLLFLAVKALSLRFIRIFHADLPRRAGLAIGACCTVAVNIARGACHH